MPLSLYEPLSMTQLFVEALYYSDLLCRAQQPDATAVDRMVLIAVFAFSAYTHILHRTRTPFNPLLGEAYECDRWDTPHGWRYLAEKVCHRPDRIVCDAQSKDGW